MVTRKTAPSKTASRKAPVRKAAPSPAVTKARRPAAAAPVVPTPAKGATAKPAKPAEAKAAKPAKGPKPPKLHRKPVRDSFTMPEADFALIATLKARALSGQRETKKSELLRAGLHALAGLDSAALVAALRRLEPVKIGRPKKAH